MRKIGDCAIHLTPLSETSVEDCQRDKLAESKDAGNTFVIHLGVHICNAWIKWIKCSKVMHVIRERQYCRTLTSFTMELAYHKKSLVRHLNLIFRSYLATSLNIKEVKSVRAGGSKGLEDFLGAIVPGKGPTSYYT